MLLFAAEAGVPQTQTTTPTSTAPHQSTAVRLVPGKPITRILVARQTHSFSIQVAKGQFLRAVVEELGLEVALRLYRPDRILVASVQSPRGMMGLNAVSMIAESDGKYRIEITPRDRDASTGRYRLLVDLLRTPTDADRARISVEQSFREATTLFQEGSLDSLRASAQRLGESLPAWRIIGDLHGESLALLMIGRVYDALGEKQTAVDYLSQSLPLWRSVGDRRGEATTLTAIGFVYYSEGEMQKALNYYEQALPLRRMVNDPDGKATTLNYIGRVYDVLGEKQKALEYLDQALQLWRAQGDRRGEATALTNIGLVHYSLGEMQKALYYYKQALPLRRVVSDLGGEATTLNYMGRVYDVLGEKQKALEYLNKALQLWRVVRDRRGEGTTLTNIGLVYYSLAETQKALDYYNQALPLRRAVSDRDGEATTLLYMGMVFDVQGKREKALEYFNSALPLWRAVGDRRGEATTLNYIGRVSDALGEKEKAVGYYNQALVLRRAAGDRDGQATTLNYLGKVYATLGERRSALESYDQALALAHEVGNPLVEGVILSNMMEFWRSAGEPPTAIFFGKLAVNKFQQIRGNIRGLEKETQESFLKSREKTYRDVADMLIDQGRLVEAQQMLDLLKNEEYFDFIRRDSREASSLTAPVDLTKSEKELNRRYENNASRITQIGNEWATLRAKPSRTPEEERKLAKLSDQLRVANDAWETFLDDLYAELGKSKDAQTTVDTLRESISAMQRVVRQLGPGTVALYTLVGEEKYRIIVVTPTVTVPHEYPIKAEDLQKLVFEFRQALRDPRSDPLPRAQELYRILIGPAAEDLDGAHAITLMWSLQGVLRYLPVAALHDGTGYLVQKYRNEVFTPASVASLTERPAVKTWRGLGMGVSKSYGQFKALPAVVEELHRLIREKNLPNSQGVLPGEMMIDEGFTKRSMKKALEGKYPLVHIASHFAFVSGDETNSFLLLGGKDTQGERLTLAEIRRDPGFNFNDTELLTLSACNTAVDGAIGDGREVDGLGRLGQQKGARAVVASLWGVYDPSTGLLMQLFYKLWTTHPRMPKVQALQEAQLALLGAVPTSTSGIVAHKSSTRRPNSNMNSPVSMYAHPYYWAPFILIGNWR